MSIHTYVHTNTHTQRYPEPDTKSAGTETTQVLNQKVMMAVLGNNDFGRKQLALLYIETPVR